jgi:hypothetical protein
MVMLPVALHVPWVGSCAALEEKAGKRASEIVIVKVNVCFFMVIPLLRFD